MAIELMVLVLVLVWLTGGAAASSSSALSLAKHGCNDTCGNSVTIPYPFGVGVGCYANKNFSITCNYSFNPPKPYLTRYNLEVLEISLRRSTINVLYPVLASDCQNWTNVHGLVNLSSPFWFSRAYNYFTGTGCDNQALMSSHEGTILGGCISSCSSNVNSYYRGICQVTPPPSLSFINASLSSIKDSKSNIGLEKECNYAFIADDQWDYYNSTDKYAMLVTGRVPAVLDWDIQGLCESNENSMRGSSCTATHSRCTTFRSYLYNSSYSIYSCYCTFGNEGNPYLSYGCQGSPRDNKKTRIIILGISTGVIGILLLLGASWWLYKFVKRRKELMLKDKFFKRNGGLLLQQQLSSGDEGNVEKSKLFTLKELEKATDHFNENRILGQGGQGTIYKGMLTDGRIIAVKKSKIVDEDNLQQFINEVVILSQINHRNVVKLHGCCLEAEVPLLIYEHIPNGTLYQYIHEQNEEFPLTWDIRVRIATEVSGALAYLHSAASMPIYHRDIKSTNILLDEKFKAKVSDFGTSKTVAIDQTHMTTLVQGTFGYLDPEYFQSSQFTEKSDVYSFGVVLAELLTGQKPISLTRSDERRSLATYFILAMKENHLLDILDARVSKEGVKEEIMRVANLARKCLNLSGRKRPTMKEVVIELVGIRMSQGISIIQQNYENDEYTVIELTTPRDVASTSTGSHLDSNVTSSLDVQPLLFR
ncbi:wall-associated receptor kinase-like 1 [Cornus florida]|uniref:wall-associated receptor kinase-like 1 n=1 Tax=Cornus florida TaxID=4283 RepID=UPI00289A7A43|nr:wall-associated receptor kinase-like 1 [Cornus florida]